MGLRINTNTSSLDALRNLHLADRAQQQSLLRLSSGLRINSGADDPSGLVISERLRAQVSALKQVQENSQNATNLVSTADAALGKVSDLLSTIQDSVLFAMNTGGASPDQIAAEQDSVDQALAAIDRVANTTRYGDKSLLNGDAGYKLTATVPNLLTRNTLASGVAFHDISFRSVNFVNGDTERKLEIKVTKNAQRAELVISGASAGSGVNVIRITGARGSADVVIGSTASTGDIASAINTVAGQTGVVALGSDGGADNLVLLSEGLGSDQFITIEGIQGKISAVNTEIHSRNASGVLVSAGSATSTGSSAIGVGGIFSDRGEDAQVEFGGQTYTAKGLAFSVNTSDVSFSFKLNSDLYHTNFISGSYGDTASTGAAGIDTSTLQTVKLHVSRTGLEFQIREAALSSDRLTMGIDSVNISKLGLDTHRDLVSEFQTGGQKFSTASSAEASGFSITVAGGFLSSLRSGQGNDLVQNAGNALSIVNAAAASVAKSRGFLGAVVGFNLQPNVDSIDVATQNLSSSLSNIRDLDFAEETANFTRTQILFQSGIAALASARTIPQSVLTLLR